MRPTYPQNSSIDRRSTSVSWVLRGHRAVGRAPGYSHLEPRESAVGDGELEFAGLNDYGRVGGEGRQNFFGAAAAELFVGYERHDDVAGALCRGRGRHQRGNSALGVERAAADELAVTHDRRELLTRRGDGVEVCVEHE